MHYEPHFADCGLCICGCPECTSLKLCICPDCASDESTHVCTCPSTLALLDEGE